MASRKLFLGFGLVCSPQAPAFYFMSSIAKQRWNILFDALVHKKTEPGKCSSRRFKTFGFFTVHLPSEEIIKESSEDDEALWNICESSLFHGLTFYIKQVDTKTSLKELQGFNNTGNICIWPSEEVLGYYCAKHFAIFKDKRICELGGGMTCLAGIVLALTCQSQEILLTDGNELAVQNVCHVIEKNRPLFKARHVHSRLLRWERSSDFQDLHEAFDFVILADCLFFESHHRHLLDAINQLLVPGGQALMLAPRRRGTFDKFVSLSRDGPVECKVLENYDDFVWEKHTKFSVEGVDHYEGDIHYPLMLVMSKTIPDRNTPKI